MAKYRALASMYVPLGGLVIVGQTIADDGTGDIRIPVGFLPNPACDPLDASAIAALTAYVNGPSGPHPSQPNPDLGILGLWGIRQQFVGLDVPVPSAAWRALIHP